MVLFEHIVKASAIVDAQKDLELLAVAVSYFDNMAVRLTALAGISYKLKSTAVAFQKLAQSIISNRTGFRTGGSVTTEESTLVADAYFSDASLSYNSPLPNRVQYESYPADSATQLQEQISTLPELSGINIDAILSCMEADIGQTQTRKRTFDSAFDWFSWDNSWLETSDFANLDPNTGPSKRL